MNSFNNRIYHPAAFVPPPYTYSNRHAGMSFKNQQQIQRPSNLACQSSKLANQFSPWQSPCQITNSQSYYPYHTGCPDPSRLRSSTTQNLSTQVPFCDSDDRITHHVPYNLTKGQYEYWMSVPGIGRNNPNCEAMQAYCHNQLPNLGCTTKHIPVSEQSQMLSM